MTSGLCSHKIEEKALHSAPEEKDMNKITQRILTILTIMIVLAYVIFNYMSGKSDTMMFLVCAGMLSYFLICMFAGLVEDLKGQK